MPSPRMISPTPPAARRSWKAISASLTTTLAKPVPWAARTIRLGIVTALTCTDSRSLTYRDSVWELARVSIASRIRS